MSNLMQAGEANKIWVSVDLGKVAFEENLKSPENAATVTPPPALL